MRSLLFVPGDSEKKLEKAFGSAADVVIVDLEDSVAPQNKETARTLAAEFIRANRQNTKAALYVRVNDLESGRTESDLGALMAVAPDGIMLPKSNSGADVQRLSARLRVHEAENGIADGSTKIIPLVSETPLGVLNAATYHDASLRIAGLTWGAEDLSAAIGARTSRDQEGRYTDVFRLARSLTLLGAASASVAAIDTVFVNFRDEEGFRRECLEAERDGFTAKLAIHPAQIEVINEVFTPSPEAIVHAVAVVEAFAAAGNPGVVAIDGQMYDIPHLRRAERLLARVGRSSA